MTLERSGRLLVALELETRLLRDVRPLQVIHVVSRDSMELA